MLLPTLDSKFLALGAYLLANAVPANAWDWANHDAIVSFPHQVPGGAINKFHPFLKVVNGCVPFPSIDVQANGRVGGGLNPSGALNGGCGSSPGQIYARAAWIDGVYGVYYAWYFPKDQILAGAIGLGHRHDWEGVVVWATDASDSASIRAICPARHGTQAGDYYCDKSNFKLQNGANPKMVYKPDGTHAVFTTDDLGGLHPLVLWENLPALGRTMLSEADFGSANVPIIDSVFESNMRNAKAGAGL